MPRRIVLLAVFFFAVGSFIFWGPLTALRSLWWLGGPLILAGLGLFLRQRWARPLGSLCIFTGYVLSALFWGGLLLPPPLAPDMLVRFEIRVAIALIVIGILTWAYATLWSKASSIHLRTTSVEEERTNS